MPSKGEECSSAAAADPSGQDDEWTFVPSRRSKKDGGGKRGANRSSSNGRRSFGQGGRQKGSNNNSRPGTKNGCQMPPFYGAAASAASNMHSSDIDASTDEGRSKMNLILRQVLQCMDALERHDFMSNLLDIIRGIPDGGAGANDTIRASAGEEEANARSPIREIVCYGIGNFVDPYSAPMLQLGCALVLRRCLARDVQIVDGPTVKGEEQSSALNVESSNGNDDTKISAAAASARFSSEQGMVKMLFFEPTVLPVERKLLENVFHIDIIPTNERGKRRVSGPPNHRTLFYMPHCPMRLYSNVLYANWDKEVLSGGNVVIFGNDFGAYDDRTISDVERSDPTNGIFRILPYVQSRAVDGTAVGRKKGRGRRRDENEQHDGALARLEVAFNDCSVTWFSDARTDGKYGSIVGNTGRVEDASEVQAEWPDRPVEHTFKDQEDASWVCTQDREVI